MILQSIKNLPILTESVTIDVTPLSLYGHAEDIAKITANIKLEGPMIEDTKFILPVCEGIKPPKIYLPNGTPLNIDSFEPTAEADIAQIPSMMQQALNTYIETPTLDAMNEAVSIMSMYSEYKQNSQTITIPAGQQYITFSYSKFIPRNDDGTYTLETIVPLSSFTLNNTPGAKANIIILMPFEMATDMSKIVDARWTAPNGQPQELIRTTIGERITLSQYWQYDPQVVVRYRY
ncbi:hypothetical protein LGK97_06695 [Clostridium sp. CS001]|uniref:hypothetical protein n=1 Tax=Clostridium sp. CS001 TaxID=2880648 RepID=UPI001CF48281|nr:hypothetical protein [Clostridium sp. CS001]MCB2289454.1 hypothetical protein [Clostridium sp. CS001]